MLMMNIDEKIEAKKEIRRLMSADVEIEQLLVEMLDHE